jgi:uncharacterized protein YkwD
VKPEYSAYARIGPGAVALALVAAALLLGGMFEVAGARKASGPVATTAGKRKVIRAQRRLKRCTNRARVAQGLRPLRAARALNSAARLHARNMARYRFFAHVDQLGRDITDRVTMFEPERRFMGLGENLAAGQARAKGACRDWMRSPGHREAMLGRWSRLGVGVAYGGPLRRYYVVDFGRRG